MLEGGGAHQSEIVYSVPAVTGMVCARSRVPEATTLHEEEPECTTAPSWVTNSAFDQLAGVVSSSQASNPPFSASSLIGPAGGGGEGEADGGGGEGDVDGGGAEGDVSLGTQQPSHCGHSCSPNLANKSSHGVFCRKLQKWEEPHCAVALHAPPTRRRFCVRSASKSDDWTKGARAWPAPPTPRAAAVFASRSDEMCKYLIVRARSLTAVNGVCVTN